MEMTIQWLGHACFLITNQAGHTLMTDPFDPSIGYPAPTARADLVTCSHGHFDHNYTDELPQGFTLVKDAGRFSGFDFEVEGIASWHDDAGGAKRGPNLMFTIEADGLRIAHLGDLGQTLTSKQITMLGHVDVLLLPVGGFYTLDARQGFEAMRMIGPRMTIPMHYRNQFWGDEKIQTVEAFAELSGAAYAEGNTLELAKETIGTMPKVLILKYK